jgi:uncharacterized membrane protein YesL
VIEALRVWWGALRHVFVRGYIYVWGTLCWAGLSLPIITAPAAWAGLVRMSHLAQTARSADLTDFWQGFKENLPRTIVLALVNVVIVVVNISNLWNYRFDTDTTVGLMRIVWILVLIIWFSIQLYLWPIFYEMEKPTVTGALRNAALMVLLNPLFTLGLWPGIIILGAISTFLGAPWLLLTGGVFASLAVSAVLNRLKAAGFSNPEHYTPLDAGGSEI